MPQPPSVTAVCRALVLHAPSGLTAASIASMLSKEYSTLMSELSGQERHKLGADLLLPLMDLTGSDEPLHVMARHRGGIYTPMPRPEDGGAMAEALLATVKEFGEFAAESAKDIADGRIPRDQLDRIQKEGQEAMSAILKFMEMSRAVHVEQHEQR